MDSRDSAMGVEEERSARRPVLEWFTSREARALTTAEQVTAYVQRHVRWNMGAAMTDALCYALAQQVMSNEIVIPLLLTSLGASTVVLGMANALVFLGALLPQLVMASVTEGLRFKKPISLLSGAVERGSYMIVGLALLIWGVSAPTLVLSLYLVLRTLGSISLGMIIPAWSTMISKVIPTRRRGQVFGVGRAVGALLGVGGALLAGYLLETQPGPRGFAYCLMIGSAILFVSWAGLALTREPPDLTVAPRRALRVYLGQLPAIVRRDRNYVWFVAARMLVTLGGMASAFIIVSGAQRFGLTGEQIGTITATVAFVQAAMYLIWGFVADRHGHKMVLCGCGLAMVAAVAFAGLSRSVIGIYAATAATGSVVAGQFISGTNILLEFAPPAERPTYVGLTSTLLAPVGAVAPVLGGLLASELGFGSLFGLAGALSLAGTIVLAFRVRDPRTHIPDAFAVGSAGNRG